jgi:phage-related tail protein
MTKIFQKLGVKGGVELIKKMGGLVPAMQAIEKQGGKMGINMAKAWSSVEAGAAVTSLTGATNAAYVSTLNDMTKGANAVDEAFEKQAATSKAQMQLMKNNMEALSITVGSVLLPILNSLINKVVPIIQKFSKWTQENQKLFKGLVVGAAVLSGLLLTISAISFGVAIATKAMVAWGVVTKLFTGLQWLLNAALNANPIGLITMGVIALISVVAIVIAKYNEWGASILLFSGVFGFVVNLIQSFRRNWDAITDAFKSGNILEGFKLIGATILDSILMPLQQVFSLMTNLPGVGKYAQNLVNKIGELRTNIGVNTTTDESGKQTELAKSAPLLNTQAQKEENMRQMFAETRSRVDLNVNDPNNRVTATSDSDNVKINVGSTLPSF